MSIPLPAAIAGRMAGRAAGPGPGSQSLELDIECFNGATGAGAETHVVTVHPDWTVTTPHDAEAERIAEAFGSYTSCVTHMERTVEAFRRSFAILTRAERVPLEAGRGGEWHIDDEYALPGCCRGILFGGVAGAAGHTRSAAHLAAQHRVPLKHLSAFLTAASATWGEWDVPPGIDLQVERLVQEPDGVRDLWLAGIHPSSLPALAEVGAVADGALPLSRYVGLPVSFYLGLVYGSVRARWVSEVLAYRPDPDTAAWLVWLDRPHTLASPADWGRWLQFGVSNADVVVVMRAGVPADVVKDVASRNGWPVRAVAAQFVKWARVGCRLESEHFHALKRHGVYAPKPSRRAIDALCQVVDLDKGVSLRRSLYGQPNRTDLAVMLEILGDRGEVIRAIRGGARNADDLDAYIGSTDRAGR